MSLIAYPATSYNSFVSVDDGDSYFADRLHADEWSGATADIKADALLTAYRSLQELTIIIDLSDTVALQAIKTAQLEQALHEIRHDLDQLQVDSLSLGGMLSVKLDKGKGEKPPRYSERSLAVLKPYLRAPVISRIR